MLRVGVVGCGAIGSVIAKSLDKGLVRASLMALNDRNPLDAEELAASLRHRPMVLGIDELIEAVDLVVESASQSAVPDIVIPALERGRDVMIMSVGALADEDLLSRILSLALENDRNVIVPSGAIAGTDGLRAAMVGQVSRLQLTTSKPPMALSGAPFIVEEGIDLAEIKSRTVLYEGPASEAVRLFPANVNVAATLGLAGHGLDKTTVRIIADPSLNRNVHEIEVEGEFGNMYVKVENVPSPENPKTSYLAALAAVAALRRHTEPLQIG